MISDSCYLQNRQILREYVYVDEFQDFFSETDNL